MTVKDYEFTTGQESKKSLHAIEAVEIDASAAGNITAQPVNSSTNHSGSTISIKDLLKGVKRDGDGREFFTPEESESGDGGNGNNGNQSKVGKTFTLADIKKSFDALKSEPAVTELFNALHGVLAKQDKVTLQFVADGEFNGSYSNGVITINESRWNQMSDHQKGRLLTHEMSHAVTVWGLGFKENYDGGSNL